jgi:hypothetical protein
MRIIAPAAKKIVCVAVAVANVAAIVKLVVRVVTLNLIRFVTAPKNASAYIKNKL